MPFFPFFSFFLFLSILFFFPSDGVAYCRGRQLDTGLGKAADANLQLRLQPGRPFVGLLAEHVARALAGMVVVHHAVVVVS